MDSETIITVENLASCPASGSESPPARREGDTARRGKRYLDVDWVVYAIANSAGRIYLGQTGNLGQRLKAHNTQRVRSTKNNGPWQIIAAEKCMTQPSARWLEFQLKRSLGQRTKWLQRFRCFTYE